VIHFQGSLGPQARRRLAPSIYRPGGGGDALPPKGFASLCCAVLCCAVLRRCVAVSCGRADAIPHFALVETWEAWLARATPAHTTGKTRERQRRLQRSGDPETSGCSRRRQTWSGRQYQPPPSGSCRSKHPWLLNNHHLLARGDVGTLADSSSHPQLACAVGTESGCADTHTASNTTSCVAVGLTISQHETVRSLEPAFYISAGLSPGVGRQQKGKTNPENAPRRGDSRRLKEALVLVIAKLPDTRRVALGDDPDSAPKDRKRGSTPSTPTIQPASPSSSSSSSGGGRRDSTDRAPRCRLSDKLVLGLGNFLHMLCIAQLFVILDAQFQRLCYLPMRPSEQIVVGLPSPTGLPGHLLGLPSTPAAAVARRLPLGWMRLRVAVPGLAAHCKTGVQQHSVQYLVVGTPFTVAIHPSTVEASELRGRCEVGGARWEERGGRSEVGGAR